MFRWQAHWAHPSSASAGAAVPSSVSACAQVKKLAFFLAATIILAGAPYAALGKDLDVSRGLFFREIRLPANFSGETFAFPLESVILEKCRPDLTDLVVVDAAGEPLPTAIWGLDGAHDPQPSPLKITKISTKRGKTTEVFFDKAGKQLGAGVLLESPSANFLRRVELRGSDNGKDWYVLRRDALLVDRAGPVPVKALRIDHPASNFQLLHLKVDDNGEDPFEVSGALLIPVGQRNHKQDRLDASVVERRSGPGQGVSVTVVDLGEKRIPARRVCIRTPSKSFVKKAMVSCAASASSDTWKVVWEGVFHRLWSDEAFSERIEARFAPQAARFIKLDVFGGREGEDVSIEEMEVYGAPIFVAAKLMGSHPQGLLYGGVNKKTGPRWNEEVSANTIAASLGASLGDETHYHKPAKLQPVVNDHRPTRAGGNDSIGTIVGVVMLAAALLLVFRFMLKRRRRTREFGLMASSWTVRTDRSATHHSWTRPE